MGSAAAPAQIPTSFGHELRACLHRGLVKTYDQFGESGCENCPFFKIDEDHERVVDCSTPNFTGNGMGPCSFSSSCKEKHRQLEQGNGGKFVPGCYTLAVSEELSEDMQNICEDKRIPYIRPKRA